MLVSTSRYASEAARRLAKSLANLTGSSYLARGKKTIERMVAEARKKGSKRVAIIFENARQPSSIGFIEVLVDGEWRWLKQIVSLKKFDKTYYKKKEEAFLTGPAATRLQQLLALDENEEEDAVRIEVSPSEITFFKDKKKIFFLEVGFDEV